MKYCHHAIASMRTKLICVYSVSQNKSGILKVLNFATLYWGIFFKIEINVIFKHCLPFYSILKNKYVINFFVI